MANFFSQLIGKGHGDSGRTLAYNNRAFGALGSSAPIRDLGGGVYDYSQALNGVQFDEFGYTSQLPADLIAPEVQLRANQIASQRNDRLLKEGSANAALALQSGLGNLSSYRPGSAAALMSPYYQGLANNYFQSAVARQQEAPDLMFRYDERMQKRAAAHAKQAGLVQGIGTLAAIAAAPFTGGASLAAIPLAQAAGQAMAPQGQNAATMGRTGVNPNQYGAPIGPPQAPGGQGQGGQQASQVDQSAWGAVDTQGWGRAASGGVGGGRQMAPGAGGAPGGGGGGPQAGPQGGGGPGAGPQGAPGGKGQGPQAGPSGGGGGVSGFPASGPATAALAAQTGATDQGLFSALMRRAFSTQPNIAHEFAARLNFIMARDVPLSA